MRAVGLILSDFLSVCLFTKLLLCCVVHTNPFSLLLVCTTGKEASTSKELHAWPGGKLAAELSVPFPSASYLPNAAFICCSLVLILALPQCISCVALGVAFLVPSKLPEPEKLLKAGPDPEGTRRSPWLAFTHEY